jgi:hypothetical protein
MVLQVDVGGAGVDGYQEVLSYILCVRDIKKIPTKCQNHYETDPLNRVMMLKV